MEISFAVGLAAVAGAFLGFLASYLFYRRRMERESEHVL